MMAIARYLQRHAEKIPEENRLPPPPEDLSLCVVIPALAEGEGIGQVLTSLGAAKGVEVIVVVNHPAGAPERVAADNRETAGMLRDHPPGELPVVVVERVYPGEVAGVGAARRTGMDLALRRLVRAGNSRRAAIACLDADSPVAPGYLAAIRRVFEAKEAPLAGVCAHRHRLPADRDQARNIVAYELWLRYIELGFAICESPYAFQTIGSCTLASPRGYALADGMPRRQAGEDFYFLQKIVKAGGPGSVVPVPGALVCPSARVSGRVPFGTGRAMIRCREGGPDVFLWAEPPGAFLDLRAFFQKTAGRFPGGDFDGTAGPRLAAFLEELDAPKVLERLRRNAPDEGHFLRSLHGWFDSLRVVRYARHCRQRSGSVWLFEGLARLLREIQDPPALGLPVPDPARPDPDLEIRWLERMRRLER